MVDDTTLALGVRRAHNLANDAQDIPRLTLDGPGQRIAAQGSKSDSSQRGSFANLEWHAVVVDEDEGATALYDGSFRREVKRNYRNVLLMDVLPCIKLGPVRQGKHSDSLTRTSPRVVKPPKLGPLLLRVPPMLGGPDRKYAFLGPRRLFVPPSSTERDVETVKVERLFETFGFPHAGVQLGAVCERIYPQFEALGVPVNHEIDSEFGHPLVAEHVHVSELPSGVDMQ